MLCRAAACLVLTVLGCAAPDRWSLTGGHGRGSLESDALKSLDFDSEANYVEVGVSGPLWKPKEKRAPQRCMDPIIQPSKPTEAPAQPSEVPWMELGLLLSGAGAWKASEVGVKKYKERRAKG